MTEKFLAREQCFALVNRKLGLIEAVSAWAYMLHAARDADPHKEWLEVCHLSDNLPLGELETIK